MPSNRTVAQPTVTSGVTDITADAQRALSRAAYEARKTTIAGLQATKDQFKAELDQLNLDRTAIVAKSRELASAMDRLDDRIAELKSGG